MSNAVKFCYLGGIESDTIMLDICAIGSLSFLSLKAGVAVEKTYTFTQQYTIRAAPFIEFCTCPSSHTKPS